jgi:hypothetical protein
MKNYDNESQLVADALIAFGMEDNLWIWRENTGRAYGVGPVKLALKAMMAGQYGAAVKLLKSLQPITFGIPGRADISGIVFSPGMPHGRPLGWEAKIKGRPRSQEQIRWADKFKAMGGFYVHFEQVEDIKAALVAEGYAK